MQEKTSILPNQLPVLKMDNREINMNNVTKFLGILTDENLTWQPQIKNTQTNIS